MDETLTGRTTREVAFIDKAQSIRLGCVTGSVRKPAGTTVYVTTTKRPGIFRIRIPQTLLEQDVYLGTVEPV
jgi:hypothetical protein